MLHPPLSDARLGARLTQIVGPRASAAQRELAARALFPAPGSETWLALYHLWALGQAPHAELAGRTAAELPGLEAKQVLDLAAPLVGEGLAVH